MTKPPSTPAERLAKHRKHYRRIDLWLSPEHYAKWQRLRGDNSHGVFGELLLDRAFPETQGGTNR